MRTIKFRGKRTDTGEWVYGYVDYTELPKVLMHTESETWEIKVIPETVGQFTGLFDKDGAEIYEGDEVHNKHDKCDSYTIQWNDKKAWFELGDNGENLYKYRLDEFWKVIGNIHDKTSDQ